MPSVKYVIELSNQEKVRLMEIVKNGNSPARTILRANILLASDKQSDKYDCIGDSKCIPYHTDNSTDCEGFLL